MKKYLEFLLIFSLNFFSSCQNNVKHASFFTSYLSIFLVIFSDLNECNNTRRNHQQT